MKPYRVEYVQMAGWEADVVGLWVAENADWLLLRCVPVDYVVDGYVLLVKPHTVSRRPRRGRRQVEQILKLKGVAAEMPPEFAFLNTIEMMRWVEQRYGLVEFTDKEQCTFLGWTGAADAVHLWFSSLSPDGTLSLDEDDPFVISEIQLICFDADYFNSLKLLWQHKARQKLVKPSDN